MSTFLSKSLWGITPSFRWCLPHWTVPLCDQSTTYSFIPFPSEVNRIIGSLQAAKLNICFPYLLLPQISAIISTIIWHMAGTSKFLTFGHMCDLMTTKKCMPKRLFIQIRDTFYRSPDSFFMPVHPGYFLRMALNFHSFIFYAISY